MPCECNAKNETQEQCSSKENEVTNAKQGSEWICKSREFRKTKKYDKNALLAAAVRN